MDFLDRVKAEADILSLRKKVKELEAKPKDSICPCDWCSNFNDTKECPLAQTRQELHSLREQLAKSIHHYKELESKYRVMVSAIATKGLTKQELTNIITGSTLWNLGADSHQALSELVEAIHAKWRNDA